MIPTDLLASRGAMTHDPYFSANRELWNTRTPLHTDSKFYDVEAFKAGRSSLCGLEQKEMGAVAGKSILHLQCHFGLDTMSLSRHGARVTGVDFSETAIEQARLLAGELGIPAQFVCCNVFDLPEHLDGMFDIVFTSFGVLGWLPDLRKWSKVVTHFLKPGGFLYLLEFHKQFIQLNEEGQVAYNYFFSEQPDEELTTQTYADGATHEPLREYWWNHTMSDIIMAVLGSGLKITLFHEFPYSAYKLGEQMIETSPGRWVHRDLREKIPYMFSLQAHKVAS